jgi:hypothetical protein
MNATLTAEISYINGPVFLHLPNLLLDENILLIWSRNRFSPRYINIATARYNAGTTAQPSPKENKEKTEKQKRKKKRK